MVISRQVMKQLFLGKSLQKPGAQEVSQKRSSPLKNSLVGPVIFRTRQRRLRLSASQKPSSPLKNALVGSGGFGSTRQEASTAHPVAKTFQGVENGACEMRGWRSLC
jgi:hypothetical protein